MPKKGTGGRIKNYKKPVVKLTHGRGKRRNTATTKTTQAGTSKAARSASRVKETAVLGGVFLHTPAKYPGVRSDSTVKKKTAERKAHSFDKAKRGSKRKRGSRGGR